MGMLDDSPAPNNAERVRPSFAKTRSSLELVGSHVDDGGTVGIALHNARLAAEIAERKIGRGVVPRIDGRGCRLQAKVGLAHEQRSRTTIARGDQRTE